MSETITPGEALVIDIKSKLKNPFKGSDLSDIGNELGIILGKYIVLYKDSDINKIGAWELDCFIGGIEHGVSLVDGTHF